MGRKAQGKKLEVLLDSSEQEQLKSICTIRMVEAEEMLRRFVLDGIKREVAAILQQHALAVQADTDMANKLRRLPYPGGRIPDQLDPPDLQGTLADRYAGPQVLQAREKCEGTCSGKCTLAQPDLDPGTLADQCPPGQLTQAAISGTLTGRINSTSGNLTEMRRVQAQSEAETGLFNLGPEATLADYVFCPEKGLRGGEADEESLQEKPGTPTADQYPLHGHHLSNPSGPISDPSNNT